MNVRTTFGITTALMVMALPTMSYAYDNTPKSVMVTSFCKNLNGGNIALHIDDLTKANNKSCRAYFNRGGWLSEHRTAVLGKVFMSTGFTGFNKDVFELKISEKSVGKLTFIKGTSLHAFSSYVSSYATIILNHETKQEVKTPELINPKYEPIIKAKIKDTFKSLIIKYQNDKGTSHWIGLPQNDDELAVWLSDKHIDKIYQAGVLNNDLTLSYCATSNADGSGGSDDRTFQDCISIPAKDYLIDGVI